MLKIIENKTVWQRDLLVAHARRVFSSIPQPANLKFLAAGVAGSDLKLVKDGIPRLRIHAVEPDETRLNIMSRDGPLGLYCELTTLDRFVSTFAARPSGNGNPHCDGHFVGADLQFTGALSAKHLLTLMALVADHRFVKPGYSMALGVTFPTSKRSNGELSRAMLKSIPATESTTPDQCHKALLSYLAKIIGEANPAIQTRSLHHEKYSTTKGAQRFFAVLEISKPIGSPQMPAPRTRVEPQHDGTAAIGKIYLPSTQ